MTERAEKPKCLHEMQLPEYLCEIADGDLALVETACDIIARELDDWCPLESPKCIAMRYANICSNLAEFRACYELVGKLRAERQSGSPPV